MLRLNRKKSQAWWFAHTLRAIVSGLKPDFNHPAHVLRILTVMHVCRAEARRLKFMEQLWTFFQHGEFGTRMALPGSCPGKYSQQAHSVFPLMPMLVSLQNSK